MTRALTVWWRERIAGTLSLTATGSLSFRYAAEWLADPAAPRLSMSLPRQEQRFPDRQCRPFFAGLLPEEGQRDAVAAALSLSKHNDFALLDALGGEVAGALTLWPEGEALPAAAAHPPTPLDDRALAQMIRSLPRRPLLAGGELRLSLAGAQPKVPVVLLDGRVALPGKGQPTTHILKPALARFPGTTENEALVMMVAKAAGLEVAPVQPRLADVDTPFLLVTRYDRRADEAGRVERLHQEDFCQALGVAPSRKYEREGGPAIKDCFELLRESATRPAVEVLKLVDAAIFNVIVGNADAHAKNFSLLYADDEVRLAPLYDALCTAAYPELSPRMAMRLGGRWAMSEMGVKTWPAFAESIGIKPTYVLRRVRELVGAVRRHLTSVATTLTPLLDARELQRVAGIIDDRAAHLLERTLPS